MSALSSPIPSIKFKTTPSTFSSLKPFTVIKCSKADGPLRRPSPLSFSPAPSQNLVVSLAQSPLLKKAAETAMVVGMMLEYQRRMAKELQDYFWQKKLEAAAERGPFFGFIAKNEIANGGWAMFGFAVGLLTEYATGSDFVQQPKILLSNFGIVDLN